MCWSDLPDILLEEILVKLSLPDRLSFALVCHSWYNVFLSPNIWRYFPVRQGTFVVRLGYNRYRKEYNERVSPYRIQSWLSNVGHHVRCIDLLPNSNYFHMFEFMSALSTCMEFYEEDRPLPQLVSFKFTFACEIENGEEVQIIGTGGKLLEEVERLLTVISKLHQLRELALRYLLLDIKEAPGLLDQVVLNCRDSVTHLEILNATKERYPLFQVGMLPHLQKLTITHLQLTDDVVQMVAAHKDMVELCIVQNGYSGDAESIKPQTWENVKRKAPHLKVRLEIAKVKDKPLVIQENAPVNIVAINSPWYEMSTTTVREIVDQYSSTLQVYAQCGLPKEDRLRSFHDRCDADLLYLVQHCPKLHTLIMNESLSTATLLKVADAAPYLQTFNVREEVVLRKSDWPRMDTWSDSYADWWKTTARSYELTEKEVSNMFRYRWNMLSDSQFSKKTIS